VFMPPARRSELSLKSDFQTTPRYTPLFGFAN
jgi:hypothetical protein